MTKARNGTVKLVHVKTNSHVIDRIYDLWSCHVTSSFIISRFHRLRDHYL